MRLLATVRWEIFLISTNYSPVTISLQCDHASSCVFLQEVKLVGVRCLVNRLERIQRSATRTILPQLCYEDRLSFKKLPTLYDFIFGLSKRYFEKTADDATHPLFNRIHKIS